MFFVKSFIATEQASFYTMCKSNLIQGECLVTVDFSENLAFVLQDAAQGFHWNNLQATIHHPLLHTMFSQESYIMLTT